MGAVVELVRVKPLSTNVTPVVPLLTLTEPSAQLPLRHALESFIVSEVPSTVAVIFADGYTAVGEENTLRRLLGIRLQVPSVYSSSRQRVR